MFRNLLKELNQNYNINLYKVLQNLINRKSKKFFNGFHINKKESFYENQTD